VYLETEKAYLKYQQEGKKLIDPMEVLSRKIKMGESLTRKDLTHWVTYNYPVLAPEHQAKVKEINEWQISYWRKQQFMVPVFWLVAFA
jgi:hypothetical protein